MRLDQEPPSSVEANSSMPLRVLVELNGLTPTDVQVECLVGGKNELGEFETMGSALLQPSGEMADTATVYHTDLCAEDSGCDLEGLKHYKIRMYPYHELLAHRFECGRMLWI